MFNASWATAANTAHPGPQHTLGALHLLLIWKHIFIFIFIFRPRGRHWHQPRLSPSLTGTHTHNQKHTHAHTIFMSCQQLLSLIFFPLTAGEVCAAGKLIKNQRALKTAVFIQEVNPVLTGRLSHTHWPLTHTYTHLGAVMSNLLAPWLRCGGAGQFSVSLKGNIEDIMKVLNI